MKNSIINRIATVLLCGVSLLAATTGWSVPKTVERWAKVVYLNPITGEASPAAGAGLVPMWGFAATELGDATVPGPQIDVDLSQNDGLAITVHNALPEPISVVIPNIGSSADMGQPVKFNEGAYIGRVRSFVPEVAPLPSTATHTYTWTNLKPGTFVYHSGSHPALQVQMGLFGMVTVKVAPGTAYPGVAIGLGGEVPVILSEIDPVLHQAVADGDYGPGKTISSTIRSVPKFFLINGRAFDPVGAIDPTPFLEPAMKNGWTTLFRVINVGWNSHIPSLTGPFPSGSANYLKVIAEDGELYPFPKTLYAPSMSAMKTMDIQFTPPADAATREYQVSDRKLGLANGGGMFRKMTAAGTTDLCTPAAIATAPVITTPTPVYDGDTVTLSAAAASGMAPLIYQWRKDGVNIPGATSATLDLGSVPLSANGSSYDVLVGNGCGSAISPAALLTVLCRPVVIATPPGPATQTVGYGTTVTYSVALQSVPNPTAPITYQWRKGGVNLSNGGNISGATSSTLVLTATTPANNGSYDVVVTNPCGSQTSPSPAAALSVVCATTTITTQPASQTVAGGATASFSVTATGTAPLTYQWRKYATTASGSAFTVVGGNSPTLALTSVTATGAGNYRVQVTNPCGTALLSANATLSVVCATTAITTQPASKTVAGGATASFNVTATGAAPLTYQWQKRIGTFGAFYINLSNRGIISGATSVSLTLTGVAPADAGQYRVVVTNPCGVQVNSGNATLSVVCATTTITTQPASQTVAGGATATFTVAATGTGPLTYQWRKYATTASGSAFTVVGGNSPTLALTGVTATEAGNYRVQVTNPCGTALLSANAVLTVCIPAAISTQPIAQTANAGGSATFSVTATGTGLTYQWRKGVVNISGATSSTLTLSSVTTATAGSYDVVVTSACGTATSTAATLTVNVGVLSAGWSTVDVGTVGIAGDAGETAGSYRVVGSGLGIPLTGNSDQFRYAYRTLAADGSITARLTSQSGTANTALAGVMIRETTATGSRFGAVVRRGGAANGVYSIRRTTTGANSSNTSSGSLTPPNCWVRVTRTGNSVAMLRSSNGTTWTTINTSTITMANPVTIGIVVTSGSNSVLDTDVFDNVTVTP